MWRLPNTDQGNNAVLWQAFFEALAPSGVPLRMDNGTQRESVYSSS